MKTKSILVLAIILFVAFPSAFARTIVAWGTKYGAVPSGDNFVAIASGERHSLALKFDGSLMGFGWNTYGQASVPLGNDFVGISGGSRHSIALKSDGSLAAWGDNTFGQLNTPIGNNFVDIACGADHSLALKSDGSLVAWGYNGQLQCDVPSGNNFVAIAAGSRHSLALKSDGSLIAWGWNAWGQCDVPSGNVFASISVGSAHNVAINLDGSLVAWGWNEYGQTAVPTGNDFVDIKAAMWHNIALKSDGSLGAWGYNVNHQCDVPLGNNFIAITAGTSYGLALTPEPAAPPVADADGPYSIFVGDTLTLDANGSTDADGDIVSYMWDLNDDETFETDAGSQAVFDVNYAELQLLGLLINHTYTIHLKVTDSEGQSDVNESTLRIEPKPALWVAVDIKPGSCPNPLDVKSSGVLPVAILGTDDVNVIDIVIASIRLADPNVAPIRNNYEDVAAPVFDANDCNCTTDGPDGFLDLTLKFETQRIVEAIGDVNHGDILTLMLTGVLFDETPIEGADCVLIRGRHKPFNVADINKDGVVDTVDFAIFSENWLQSSIIKD